MKTALPRFRVDLLSNGNYYVTKSTFAEVVKVLQGNPTINLLMDPKRTVEYISGYYKVIPSSDGVQFGVLFDEVTIRYIPVPFEGKPLVDAIVGYIICSPLVTNVVESDDFV